MAVRINQTRQLLRYALCFTGIPRYRHSQTIFRGYNRIVRDWSQGMYEICCMPVRARTIQSHVEGYGYVRYMRRPSSNMLIDAVHSLASETYSSQPP